MNLYTRKKKIYVSIRNLTHWMVYWTRLHLFKLCLVLWAGSPSAPPLKEASLNASQYCPMTATPPDDDPKEHRVTMIEVEMNHEMGYIASLEWEGGGKQGGPRFEEFGR